MNKAKYTVLDRYNVDWKQVDAEHIEVIFHGHFDDNYAGLESAFNKAGLQATRRTYLKDLNKTITIYKRT